MSYESEERLMVQGIEADARRWPAHGEIPPTHEELVKMEKDKERQKMIDEVVNDLEGYYGTKDSYELAECIRNWQPKEKQCHLKK